MTNEERRAYRDHGDRIQENIEKRLQLYGYMSQNPEIAAYEKHLCSIDYDDSLDEPTGIIRFFENHLWTHEPRGHILKAYNPNFVSPVLPFILFDFQKAAVLKMCECIDTGQDVLIEKSRDMGVSWFVVSVFFYYWWREQQGNDFLLGSRKLEYVDKKGATDTLFEKVRYNLYRLHETMIPSDFESNKNDNVAMLTNPNNGNYMRGEANNPNFATSGRYRAILADEFSKWEESDDAAYTSMGDSSPCRIIVSTPWGIGRKFAQLRFSGAIEVLSFHWSEHPIKGAGKYRGQHPIFQDRKDVWLSPWYIAECERRRDNPQANIGQELDIDYLSSGTPYFNNKVVQDRIDEHEEVGVRWDFVRNGDDIELREDSYGRIVIVKEPVFGWRYRYVIGADVAEGLEKGDNSVFYVYDRVTGKDVAWFCGKIDTTVFALLLSYFGYWYCEAYIGVEANNHGHSVVQKLKEIYNNLFREMDFTKDVDVEKVRIGWMTNSATRPIMCGDLREAVHAGSDGTLDKQFLNECRTFVYNKNGKPEADTGCLDDRVMSKAITFQVHKWLPAPIESVKENEKKYSAPRWGGFLKRETRKDIRKIW